MYYSPILFRNISDVILTQFDNDQIDIEKLNQKEKIIIFSKNSMEDLNKLKPYLDKIVKPFIIITAIEDTEFPREIDADFLTKIKNNIYFKHWFAINKTIPDNDKFTSIPYGLDYWTLNYNDYFDEIKKSIFIQDFEFSSIINSSKHFSERKPLIFCNYHFLLSDKRYGNMREKLPYIIPGNIACYQAQRVPKTRTLQLMKEFSFVLSPHGNGLDCIRTFEALCLGCIVIMKKNCLDIVYKDLPVLFVDEWTDINEELLKKTLEEYSNKKFNYKKLKMDYWVNLVNSKF
jgi:hypothetical protein